MKKHNKKFIQYVKKICKQHNVTLIFSKTDTITVDKIICGGYFDPIKKIINISNGNETWIISTLVHEFSHMEQWIDKDPTFYHYLPGGIHPEYIVDNWINGKQYKKSTITAAINLTRDYELNCERRAIANIKKHNLEIDVQHYAKKANSYIMMYNFMKHSRIWESPYDELIINAMPDNMDTLNYNRFPKKYKSLYQLVFM